MRGGSVRLRAVFGCGDAGKGSDMHGTKTGKGGDEGNSGRGYVGALQQTRTLFKSRKEKEGVSGLRSPRHVRGSGFARALTCQGPRERCDGSVLLSRAVVSGGGGGAPGARYSGLCGHPIPVTCKLAFRGHPTTQVPTSGRCASAGHGTTPSTNLVGCADAARQCGAAFRTPQLDRF